MNQINPTIIFKDAYLQAYSEAYEQAWHDFTNLTILQMLNEHICISTIQKILHVSSNDILHVQALYNDISHETKEQVATIISTE